MFSSNFAIFVLPSFGLFSRIFLFSCLAHTTVRFTSFILFFCSNSLYLFDIYDFYLFYFLTILFLLYFLVLLSSKYLFIIFRRVFLLPIETVFLLLWGHKFRSIWHHSYLNTIEVSFFFVIRHFFFSRYRSYIHFFPLYTLLAKSFLFSLPFHLQHKLFLLLSLWFFLLPLLFSPFYLPSSFSIYSFFIFSSSSTLLFILLLVCFSCFLLNPISSSTSFAYLVSSFTSNCSSFSFFLSFDLSLIFRILLFLFYFFFLFILVFFSLIQLSFLFS